MGCENNLPGLGKCAFVTGGSRGIGRGIAEVLASKGYDIAITYSTSAEGAEETAKMVTAMGRRCFYYQASLELPDTPEKITKKAIGDLGRIDVLINNAGHTTYNLTRTLERERMDFIYGLNYRNPMLCSKAASAYMVEHGIRGNIVHIASTRGIRSYPEDSVYGGLKAALIRSTESMALELSSDGIRVNCVAPGMTKVRGDLSHERLCEGFGPKIPMGRTGSPYDVGNAVAFLVSDEASYITGVTLKVDGGLILPGPPEDMSPEAGYGWGKISGEKLKSLGSKP